MRSGIRWIIALHALNGALCFAAPSVPPERMAAAIGEWSLLASDFYALDPAPEVIAAGGERIGKTSVVSFGAATHRYKLLKGGILGSAELNQLKVAAFGSSPAERLASAESQKALPDRFSRAGLGWSSSVAEWERGVRALGGFNRSAEAEPGRFEAIESSGLTVGIGRSYRRVLSWRYAQDPRIELRIEFDGPAECDDRSPFTMAALAVTIRAVPIPTRAPEAAELDSELRFALGLSGLLAQLSDDLHERVVPGAPPRNQSRLKMLSESWGIRSRDELLDTFARLQTGLHSSRYARWEELLDRHRELEPVRIIERERLDLRSAIELLYVQGTRTSIGRRGIEAWDLGRSVSLIRWGREVGWLDDEEAVGLIRSVWERVRDDYAFWDEWFLPYIAGRGFWSCGEKNQLLLINQGISAWRQLAYYEGSVYAEPWPTGGDERGPDRVEAWTPPSDPLYLALSDLSVAIAAVPQNETRVLRVYDRLLGISPDFVLPRLARVDYLIARGRSTEALGEAQSLMAANPSSIAAPLSLAKVLTERGDLAGAERLYWETLDADPSCWEANLKLAVILHRRGETKQAWPYFSEAARNFPFWARVSGDPDAWLAYAWSAMANGDISAASGVLDKVADAAPNSAVVKYAVGVCRIAEAGRPGLSPEAAEELRGQAFAALTAARTGGVKLPASLTDWITTREGR